MVRALATVMLGAWPEPFGLVAIESMATGTPVIARRAGGLTETIDHGVTGFLVDDVDEAALAVSRAAALDRADIITNTRERFSVDRMVDAYESVYRRLTASARIDSEAVAIGETEVEPLDGQDVERRSSTQDLIAATR
jgi:glycosyltransferase involved in cell wall biosynthesis